MERQYYHFQWILSKAVRRRELGHVMWARKIKGEMWTKTKWWEARGQTTPNCWDHFSVIVVYSLLVFVIQATRCCRVYSLKILFHFQLVQRSCTLQSFLHSHTRIECTGWLKNVLRNQLMWIVKLGPLFWIILSGFNHHL